MFRIETHLHTCHSSPCGKVEADTIARLYAEAGFHGIIVTDHFFHYTCRPHCWNIPYGEYFKVFLEGYHQLCKAAEPYGLKIYKGAEVRFDESTNDYLMYNFPDHLLQDPEAVFAMEYAVDGMFRRIGMPFAPARHTWVGARLMLFAMPLDGAADMGGHADFGPFEVEALETL